MMVLYLCFIILKLTMDRYENVQRNSVVRPYSSRNNSRDWEELGYRRKLALEKEKEKNDAMNNAMRLSFRYYFKNRMKHPFNDETYENKFYWYRWKPIVPHSGKDQLPKHIREISRRTMKISEERSDFYTLAMWEEAGNPDIFQQYQTHIRNVPSYDLVSVDNTLNNSRWLEYNLGEILDKFHANELMNPHFELYSAIRSMKRKKDSIDEARSYYQCAMHQTVRDKYDTTELSKAIKAKEILYQSLVRRVPYVSFLEKLKTCLVSYIGLNAIKEWKRLINCDKTYKKSLYRKMFKHWKILCKRQRENRRRLYEEHVKSR